MELSGDNRGWNYPPGPPGIVHALPPYCYRCPFGLTYPGCGIRCAEHIAELIEWEGPQTVAAVLVEPAAGTNGITAPPEYWPRLREICDRYGVLLVADEVMSGFGRTGEWFAWQGLPSPPAPPPQAGEGRRLATRTIRLSDRIHSSPRRRRAARRSGRRFRAGAASIPAAR